MPNFYCCVPDCGAATKKLEQVEKYPWMDGVTFWPLPWARPRTIKLRKIWLDRIRREDGNLPENKLTRVCSLHFQGKDGPTQEHPVPSLFPYNNWGQAKRPRKLNKLQLHEFVRAPTPMSDEEQEDGWPVELLTYEYHAQEEIPDCAAFEICQEECLARSEAIQPPDPAHDYCVPTVIEIEPSEDIYACKTSHVFDTDEGVQASPATAEASTQSEMTQDQVYQLIKELQTTKHQLHKKTGELDQVKKQLVTSKGITIKDLFMKKVLKSDKSCSEFTGFPELCLLHATLEMANESLLNIKYWRGKSSTEKKQYERETWLFKSDKPGPKKKLSRLEQMTLTLIRLKKGFTRSVLGQLFDVSEANVTEIFTTWLFILDDILEPLRQWPSSEVLRKHQPPGVKKDYPKTTVIIDCAEFFIERPRNPTAQSITYSQYKSHNTYKGLFGISPTGAFIFVSHLYGGNISDRHITEVSGFLDFVKPGDDVMADRGFTIRSLLQLRCKATLNMPPFTRKCSYGKGKRLNDKEIKQTRKIAKHRIHVERAIQRLKLFRLLSGGISNALKPVIDICVRVAASLCNLQPPLAK